MGRKVSSTRARARASASTAPIKWSVLLVDGCLNVAGVLREDLSLSKAIEVQEAYNSEPGTGVVATVLPTDRLRKAVDQTDWTITKAKSDLNSFTRSQIAHRLYRVRIAEEYAHTLGDLGAIARSLEDTAKGLRGHDEFLRGYDHLEASPKVLERLGYEKD